MFKKSKSKKLGPLKALPSDVTRDDAAKSPAAGKSFKSAKASKPSDRSSRKTRDDLAISQMREKLTANPYATIKMWRPVSSTSAIFHDRADEGTYPSFRTFDAATRQGGEVGVSQQDASRPTGLTSDKTRLSQSELWRHASMVEQQGFGRSTDQRYTWVSEPNSEILEVPEDYSRDNSPASEDRHVVVSNGTLEPPNSTDSFNVVSDGVSKAIQQILGHSYSSGHESEAIRDVETLLGELKVTMKSIKTSRIEKTPGQLSMCVAELQSQTRQFIQDAKLIVASANSDRDKLLSSLQAAIHTLAHIFLHSQATMLLVHTTDVAERLGFQLIKVANSFKTTLSAANGALGKAIGDPDMKYLMRHASNLASLLGTLLNTIKDIQQGGS